MAVTRGKNPVTLHLFIDCAYHAHMVPQLLRGLREIDAKLQFDTTQRLVSRFGSVYGSQGIQTLFDAQLIDEATKHNALNALSGTSPSEPCHCEPAVPLHAAMWI